MKRLIAIFAIIICIFFINIIFVFSKSEEVLLVGDLVGFQISNETNTDDIEGLVPVSYNSIGTMTFINEKNNQFVALGHKSSDEQSKSSINSECFGVKLKCINKSNENYIGSAIGEIDKDKKIGYIYEDTDHGVIGKVDNMNSDEYIKVQAVSRYKVRKGNAQIFTKLNSDKLESFDINITNVNYFNDNMNIELEITDERLISKLGGIIQGMSGTPILQDGNLIGILNYVETNNSKKAYAIFVDKFI